MQQYDSMTDKVGNIIEGRICVYVFADQPDEVDFKNGEFGVYQISKIITTEKAGILFIINESDLDKLTQYKISFDEGNPKLVRKDETETE